MDIPQEPKQFMTAILEIYEHFSGIVAEAFGGAVPFTDALHRACCDFINKNAITTCVS